MGIIDNLRTTLTMGARANKYKITIHPGSIGGLEKADILCKSASMPGRSFADIEVWVQGRLLTIAGDAQYEGSWSATFMDNQDHGLRKEFLAWMEYIDAFKAHTRATTGAPDYMGIIIVEQLNTVDGSSTYKQTLHNVYPKSMSEITYADDNSALTEFSVEFNYSHWE